MFSMFKQVFWKTKFLLKKLESGFLVVSTTIENTTFPYKTALLKANVKTYNGEYIMDLSQITEFCY